jgi:hypothetical protein
VARVEFYRGDLLLGVDEDGSDGWSWTGSTAAWDLGEHTLFAVAVDNDGASSPMVSATVRVYAELEPVDFGGVPIFVTRARSLNVHNDGTGPLLVEGIRPGFAVLHPSRPGVGRW